jgi:serine/threonine protein kinase
MAPEIIAEEEATPSADLFSLGVMMYILLTGNRSMFFDHNQMTSFKKILSCEYELEQHKNLSENAIDLIQKLLVREPSERLGAKSFDDLKAHPFFEGINFNTLFL